MSLRVVMRKVMLLTSVMVLGLSSCAQPSVTSTEQTKINKNDHKQVLSEKCENAKYQLDKTVEEGQLSNLRELKRNIELYCVWRRD